MLTIGIRRLIIIVLIVVEALQESFLIDIACALLLLASKPHIKHKLYEEARFVPINLVIHARIEQCFAQPAIVILKAHMLRKFI